MTALDFLTHRIRPSMPSHSKFVWVSVVGARLPSSLEAGDEVTLHGLPCLVTNITRNCRGEKLQAAACTWIPADQVQAAVSSGLFQRTTQPLIKKSA